MTYLNGGYSIIKKGDANIYASLEKALTNGKPILFYEDDNTCYYIDTISKSGDDIILTKGGKTITITDANVITEKGEIQNHLYALSFDLTDLTLDGAYTAGNSNYFTILTGKKFTKLSEFTDGYYPVVLGTIVSDGNEIQIEKLYIDNGTYTFTLADDDGLDFTISQDSIAVTTQIF